MKKNLLGWSLLSAAVMFLLPWSAITFAKSDAGMAIIFLLFFCIDPVFCAVVGFFAGKHIRKMWSLPLIAAVMFLLGAWMFFAMGEIAFVIYAGVYFVIGIAVMIVSALIQRKMQRE